MNLIFCALGSYWWISRRRMLLLDLQRSLWLLVEALGNGLGVRGRQGDGQGGGCSGLDQKWQSWDPGRYRRK